jgi:hypothetical protein
MGFSSIADVKRTAAPPDPDEAAWSGFSGQFSQCFTLACFVAFSSTHFAFCLNDG